METHRLADQGHLGRGCFLRLTFRFDPAHSPRNSHRGATSTVAMEGDVWPRGSLSAAATISVSERCMTPQLHLTYNAVEVYEIFPSQHRRLGCKWRNFSQNWYALNAICFRPKFLADIFLWSHQYRQTAACPIYASRTYNGVRWKGYYSDWNVRIYASTCRRNDS